MNKIDELIEMVKHNKEKDGEVIPCCIIDGDESLIMGLADLPKEQSDRAFMMRAMGGTMGFGLNAHDLYVIVDTWYKEALDNKDDAVNEGEMTEERHARILPYGSVEADPDRQEAIMVCHYPRDGEAEVWIVQYKSRPIDEKLHIEWSETRKMEGDYEDYTFSNFFEGVRESELKLSVVNGIADVDDDFSLEDTGKTLLEVKRQAARQLGLKIFQGEFMTDE